MSIDQVSKHIWTESLATDNRTISRAGDGTGDQGSPGTYGFVVFLLAKSRKDHGIRVILVECPLARSPFSIQDAASVANDKYLCRCPTRRRPRRMRTRSTSMIPKAAQCSWVELKSPFFTPHSLHVQRQASLPRRHPPPSHAPHKVTKLQQYETDGFSA